MAETALEHLFAYGTLRPESAPPGLAHLLRAASSLGAAWVPGELYDLGPYPGAIAPSGNALQASRVYGEVLAFRELESRLPELDAYEGFDPASPHSSLFVRKPCTATLSSGRTLPCWIYLYGRTPHASAHIPSGRWERSLRS
jgi:gamma-glutamylcyclotransferase (GGCT)/AIG2-like uncharacterized protein YtfP